MHGTCWLPACLAALPALGLLLLLLLLLLLGVLLVEVVLLLLLPAATAMRWRLWLLLKP
jgi:hypothetical protein